jgi:hypothetical protein
MNIIQITDSTTINITPQMGNEIEIYTPSAVALSSNLTIQYSGTPTEGSKIILYCDCIFTGAKGVIVTIFGQVYQLPLFSTANAITMVVIYNGAWKVYSYGNINVPQLSYDIITPQYFAVTSGNTIDLNDSINTNRIILGGIASISSSFIIEHTGTPLQGQEYKFTYNALVTYSAACSVTILGRALTQSEALSGNLYINAIYYNSTWYVTVSAPLTTQSQSFSLTVLDSADVAGGQPNVQSLHSSPLPLITGISGYVIFIESAFCEKIGRGAYATNTNLVIVSSGENPLGVFTDTHSLLSVRDGEVRPMDRETGLDSCICNGENIILQVYYGNPTGGGTNNGIKVFGTYKYIAIP